MTAPDYHSSAGQEVIELAEMAGLFLEPWQQLVVRHMFGEKRDGTMSAFEVAVIVSRQNGKGSIIEAAELGWLFLLKEPLIMHTAHEVKTSDEAFRRIKQLILNTPELTKRCKKPRDANGQQAIETLAGQRLRFIARSKGSGRGFSAPRLVLDEAYDLDERHMSALFPTMSAMADPQIVYMSSAPRAEDEVLNALCDRGAAGTSSRLAYFEWSADPDRVKEHGRDDRLSWAQSNPALGYGRVTEEFIAMEMDALPATAFLRERLGIREDPNAGGPISLAVWADRSDAASSALDPVAFAVDVSPDRQMSTISSVGARSDGMLHVEVVDRRPSTDWVVRRLKELSTWQPRAIVVDAGAAAGSLLPDLAEAGIVITSPSVRELGQATGAFIDLVNTEDKMRHLGQQSMADAIAGAKLRPLGDAFAWDRRHSSVDITPLVSATLAVWGFTASGFVDVTQAIH